MKTAISISLLVTSLWLVSCGSSPSGPTISPSEKITSAMEFSTEVDPQIARIYGDTPITGKLPSSIIWSPNGAHLAYMKTRKDQDDKKVAGLWIMDMKNQHETPLISKSDFSVDGFVWMLDDALVLESDGDLYMMDLDGNRTRLTETDEAEEGVQASPTGGRVAYVRNNDLYVMDVKTVSERKITSGGSDDRYYGGVTWVYGEELGTEAGFGWSPDGSKLWVYAVDETEVSRRTVVVDAEGNTRTQAYPRAGEQNPVVRVGAVDLSTSGDVTVKWLDTGDETDIYLPQVTWHPDGDRLIVARLDRLQTVLELLMCDTGTGVCKGFMDERDPRWVNLLGEPIFIKGGGRLLWLSERNGFAHIYKLSVDGLVEKQLTDGEWVVTSIDSVDEKNGYVYFTGNAKKPVTYGIFRVPLAGGDIERVSPAGGVHNAVFSKNSSRYVDTHSALDSPPVVDLFDNAGTLLKGVAVADRGRYSCDNVTNDLFPIETSDGLVFWAQLTRPRAFEPARRYPVLIYVYGGPGAQVVKDHFRTSFQAWRNLLAKRGILVFSMDGRGSTGRGKAFETPIHRNLGKVELEDQLAGIKYLVKQPYVDEKRLAIFGWSYGGTMSLRSLLLTKDIFQAGIAVAPVTDWRQYDTAYTERYMQRPKDNPEGYDSTTLLDAAKNLDLPLLLVHGLGDDNVHFANSGLFVNALIEAGKSFSAMFYPGAKHGIRESKARIHLFSAITRFIEDNL